MIVLEGIILSTLNYKPIVMVMPGNLLLTPHFQPDSMVTCVLNDEERKQNFAQTRYDCFTSVVVGTFSNKAIDELLKDYRFLHAVWENTQYQGFFMHIYQSKLFHGDAYGAVKFVLRCAREHGGMKLTHEQIAELAGRNRTTVTKAMHEIALAEPELLEDPSLAPAPLFRRKR